MVMNQLCGTDEIFCFIISHRRVKIFSKCTILLFHEDIGLFLLLYMKLLFRLGVQNLYPFFKISIVMRQSSPIIVVVVVVVYTQRLYKSFIFHSRTQCTSSSLLHSEREADLILSSGSRHIQHIHTIYVYIVPPHLSLS